MDRTRTYPTKRDQPLLFVGAPLTVPVLTAVNYTKWYELYLVQPDGTVTEVDSDDVMEIASKDMDANWVDHLYHPRLLWLLARHLNAELDERLLEVAIGRWLLEGPDDGKLAKQLHFDEPSSSS